MSEYDCLDVFKIIVADKSLNIIWSTFEGAYRGLHCVAYRHIPARVYNSIKERNARCAPLDLLAKIICIVIEPLTTLLVS